MTKTNSNQPVTAKLLDSALKKAFKLQNKQLDRRFKTIDQRFKTVDQNFKAVDQRFDSLIKQMNSLFRIQKNEFQNLSDKFDKHQQKQDKRYSEMMKHIDGIAGNCKRVDEAQIISAHQIQKHEDRIEKLEDVVFAIA